MAIAHSRDIENGGNMSTCPECHFIKDCFFSELSRTDRDQFEKHLVPNRYKKNQVVIYEGIEPHGVYLLCEGRTKVYKTDESGRQLTVRTGRPGDLVGYRSILLTKPYSASVEAVEPSRIAFLDRQYFFDLLEKNRELSLKLTRMLAEQLGTAEATALRMAYHSSFRRVADLLKTSVPGNGQKPNGKAPVTLPPVRRQDLAEMAGLALETTIRVLKEMEEQGIIKLDGRQITILNSQKLERLAQPLQ